MDEDATLADLAAKVPTADTRSDYRTHGCLTFCMVVILLHARANSNVDGPAKSTNSTGTLWANDGDTQRDEGFAKRQPQIARPRRRTLRCWYIPDQQRSVTTVLQRGAPQKAESKSDVLKQTNPPIKLSS
ncbi:MAG: hypothetical protein ACRD4O_09155, partial [Bryobacteraceae bacterium]